MRNAADEPEIQLDRALEDFYAQYGRFQGTSGETRMAQFEQPLDMLYTHWTTRLEDLEKAEIRACRTAADLLIEGEARAANRQDNRFSFAATKDLGPQMQYLMWNSTNRSDAPSAVFVQDRQREADGLYNRATKVVQERYNNMREILENGYQELVSGREPSLTRTLGNAAPAAEPSTLEEYRRRRAGMAQGVEAQILGTQEIQQSIT